MLKRLEKKDNIFEFFVEKIGFWMIMKDFVFELSVER